MSRPLISKPNSVLPGWVAVVCCLLSGANVAHADKIKGARTSSILLIYPSTLSPRVVERVRSRVAATLGEEGYGVKHRDPRVGGNLGPCMSNNDCLFTISEELDTPYLLLVKIEAKGGNFDLTARLWSPLQPARAIEKLGVPSNRLRAMVDEVSRLAIRLQGIAEPEPPLEAIEEPKIEEIRTVPVAGDSPQGETPSATVVVPVTGRAIEIETSPFETAERLGIAIAVSGSFLGLTHHGSRLAIRRTITRNDVGAGSLGLGARFRLPLWPELFATTRVSYSFVFPLFAMSFEGGLEQNFVFGERFSAGFGLRYALGMAGLPFPPSDDPAGVRYAYRLVHGLEAYASAAVEIVPRWSIRLHAGYRHFPAITYFSQGGDDYFLRDRKGRIWDLKLGGPTASLVVAYEF